MEKNKTINMNKKKHILILGGSSDIGIEVVKMILNLDLKIFLVLSLPFGIPKLHQRRKD